jgi:nitrate reductase NapE component
MRHAEVIDSWRRRGDLALGLVLLLLLRLPVLGVPMVGALLGFLVGVADAQKRL